VEHGLRDGQLFTPFFQGIILGALTTGQIRVEQGRILTGFMAGWLTPFALSCGVFALGLFAFLAATYLTLDTRDEPDLQDDFRRRALWSGLALAPIALVVFLTSRGGAPAMYHELTALVGAGAAGVDESFCQRGIDCPLAATLRGRKAGCDGQVTFILLGWGLAQYPNLVAPDVTVTGAAAPEFTLPYW